MKEELKESPLKKRYDDAMLEGSIEGAYLTQRYENIIRTDGLANRDFSVRDNARYIAEDKGIDDIVVGGIATAILDSLIIYGDIGEKFLKEKLEQEGQTFSRIEFARDVAESITELYQYDRKQRIIDGVDDALKDNYDNVEATAAKAAILQDEYDTESRYDEGRVVVDKFLKGENEFFSSEKILTRLNSVHYGKISEEQALRNLNIAYQYLSNEYDQLSPTFKEQFEGLSEKKILAYYIANLQGSEMERVLRLAKEERNDKER